MGAVWGITYFHCHKCGKKYYPPKCFGYVNSTSKDDPNPVRDCSECLLLQPCIAEYDERVYDNPYDPSFFDGELSDEERGGVF
jgi:NAD-dependent SIR2 family protein deacetylase